ncbi:MAG: LLM class flavin-dependent oxidoreductase, partial [Acidimicrobiia bacterium]
MDFGVVLQTDPPATRVVELAKRAEELGFSKAWTFDSHVLWQEPFVIYSRILEATRDLVVGPMVTNPGTRDWTVIASLFATLDEMFGPRTICGMGRGDSALRYIGRTPTTLQTMVQAMDVIKRLVAGQEVEYNDQTLSFPWVGDGWDLP